jgi:hypothetical protein
MYVEVARFERVTRAETDQTSLGIQLPTIWAISQYGSRFLLTMRLYYAAKLTRDSRM